MSELKEYTVLRPIAYGGRVEAGSTVKFDDETAATFAPGFLQLKEPVAEAVAAPVTASSDEVTGGVDGDSQPDVTPVTEPVPPVEPAPTEPVTPPADPVAPVTEPQQPVV